jgi:hypothetical protein
MYVYLIRDQDKKEREALLKALSYQSRPISSVPPLCFPDPLLVTRDLKDLCSPFFFLTA